jgi:hypothetical protein
MEHLALLIFVLIYITVDRIVSYFNAKEQKDEVEFCKWKLDKHEQRISKLESKQS